MQRSAWARSSSASSCRCGRSASSSTSSVETSLIVASGVPSSCAAAATTPPSALSCCSRASAIWVAASACDIEKVSSVTRRTKIARNAVPITSAAQVPAASTGGIAIGSPDASVSGT